MNTINKYIITDNENYVSNQNATGITQNKDNAYMWSSKVSAENVLLTATERKDTSKHIVLSNKYFVKELKLYESEIDADIEMDVKTISEFLDILLFCENSQEDLVSELSALDRKLSDIEHFIEFKNVNSVDGYRIYKKIQDIRKRRRYVKYRLKIASDINSQHIDSDVLKNLIKYFKNRYYKPREIDFEDILK